MLVAMLVNFNFVGLDKIYPNLQKIQSLQVSHSLVGIGHFVQRLPLCWHLLHNCNLLSLTLQTKRLRRHITHKEGICIVKLCKVCTL